MHRVTPTILPCLPVVAARRISPAQWSQPLVTSSLFDYDLNLAKDSRLKRVEKSPSGPIASRRDSAKIEPITRIRPPERIPDFN